MNRLLDTDTCVFWMNDRGGVKTKAESFASGLLGISTITITELYFGAENSQRVAQNRRNVENLIAGLEIADVTIEVAEQYGKLRAGLKSKGTPAADMDLFIVSTALVHGIPLVTNNMRHYQNIPNLSIENWVK